MNKRLQGFIAGITAGVILASGAAFAANTTTWYDVLANGIKIIIDGVKIKPKDSNGNTVEPIIYNGTTYLPVRAIADALGLDVSWDGSTYTVYLETQNGNDDNDDDDDYSYSKSSDSTKLVDLTNIGEGWGETNDLTDNYGNRYSNAIASNGAGIGYTFGYKNYTAQYLLDEEYSRLTGTIYISSGEDYDGSAGVVITADGKDIYTSPEITKKSHPIDIDIDISDCDVLEITNTGDKYLNIYIGNGELTK